MKSLAAIAVIGAMVSGMGALPAAAYDPCDVNQDGTVSMIDVIAINQHLAGTRYFTDYNKLDANRSHTIDKTDSNCVLQKLVANSYSACYIRQYPNAYMGVVNMPAVSSTVVLDDSANNTQGRWYIGYSYLDNAAIPRYQLTPTTAPLSSTHSNQSRSLVNGDDNRGIAHGYENTGIVYVGGTTGFIVGDHQIATAAHSVTSGTTIERNVEVFTYDRTGLPVEGGELTVAEIHIPEDYTVACTEYDYALITVVEDLSDYVHFNIGNSYNMTADEAGTIPIHVTGCPQYIGNNSEIENTSKTLYTHNGSIFGNDNKSLFHYTADTTGGQSGAPVYTITRERYNNTDYYTYTALAIHTGGAGSAYNFGTLMSQYHVQFYGNNPNISYQ